MPTSPHRSKDQICPNCAAPCPADAFVCPLCHTRLPRRATPPLWLILLLGLVIAGLALYATLSAWQVFVLHNY